MPELMAELGFYVLGGAPESPRALIDEVRDAEDLGRGAPVLSYRFDLKEAVTLSGAAAAVSSRLRIITAATNHTRRLPVVDAQDATPRLLMTGGRFTLGLGR